MSDRTPPAPWEHQPYEDADSFARFLVYLDSDGDLGRVSERTALSRGTLAAYAARGRWRARRLAYLQHLGQESVAAAEETARTMGERHAVTLSRSMELITASLDAYAASGAVLPPDELRQWIKLVIEQQRLMRGQATARVDLTTASPEALDALEAALARVEGGGAGSPEGGN